MKINHLSQKDWGKTRTKRFFALLPITLNYQTRWLEMVTIEEQIAKSHNENPPIYYWKRMRFIDE